MAAWDYGGAPPAPVPRRVRQPTPDPPARTGVHHGLAYTLWLPREEPVGGVVIVHGAGSSKENHHDFARGARAAGLAAVAFDQRGHGDSEGELGDGALDDVAAMADLLRPGPVALRGSSMGGYLALVAAERVGAAAVVAICPAPGDRLLRLLRQGELEFRADRPALERLLEEHDLHEAVARLRVPLMLQHAEGDERIPAEHSRELHDAAGSERKRLIVVPGGHHGSVQHDGEMQGESLRFIERALRAAA